MANKKKYKSYSKKTGCREPLGILVDIAGAAAMRAIAKKKLKRDIEKGCGEESAEAALAVFGAGAMRGGSTGLVNLGGLYGIKSALEDTEKGQTTGRITNVRTKPVQSEEILVNRYKPNNNKYAWRLNCADGGEYGIYPENFETREEYSEAIENAKDERIACSAEEPSEKKPDMTVFEEHEASDMETYVFCKVSRLDNGANQYYLADDFQVNVGDLVSVPSENGTTVKGVVLSVEKFTKTTAPQDPENTTSIIGN